MRTSGKVTWKVALGGDSLGQARPIGNWRLEFAGRELKVSQVALFRFQAPSRLSLPALAASYLAALSFLVCAMPATAGELHKAARNGDLLAVNTLLGAGAEVNELDGEGETALHKAAGAGHAQVVVALLAAGADPLISGKGSFGSTGTPLHLAAKQGNADCIRAILAAGVDPDLPDAGVGPPLHLAIYYRRQAAVDLLISSGARAVVAEPIDALIAQADPQDGQVISVSCEFCHHLDAAPPGKRYMGPPLWGIVGKPKASAADFAYSDAMKAAGGAWSYDELNRFLADPRGYTPGTKMLAPDGIKAPERRAALIRYLRNLSDVPPLLPE